MRRRQPASGHPRRAYQYIVVGAAEHCCIGLAGIRGAFAPSIEVASARAEWLELVVPQGNGGTHSNVHRETDADLRNTGSLGQAFRELLMNAIKWGGQLIGPYGAYCCLRTKRTRFLPDRRSRPGFAPESPSAAVSNAADNRSATCVRGKGPRPGASVF